ASLVFVSWIPDTYHSSISRQWTLERRSYSGRILRLTPNREDIYRQGCQADTILLLTDGRRLPANAYDSCCAASSASEAYPSKTDSVSREIGPEMHKAPNNFHCGPKTGAEMLDTCGSRAPSEMAYPFLLMDSYGSPGSPENARMARPGPPMSRGRIVPIRT